MLVAPETMLGMTRSFFVRSAMKWQSNLWRSPVGLPWLARKASKGQAAADWPDYRTSGLRCKRGAMLMKFRRWYVVPTLVFFGSMERF